MIKEKIFSIRVFIHVIMIGLIMGLFCEVLMLKFRMDSEWKLNYKPVVYIPNPNICLPGKTAFINSKYLSEEKHKDWEIFKSASPEAINGLLAKKSVGINMVYIIDTKKSKKWLCESGRLYSMFESSKGIFELVSVYDPKANVYCSSLIIFNDIVGLVIFENTNDLTRSFTKNTVEQFCEEMRIW